MKKTILIDMDGVITDFDLGLLNILKEKFDFNEKVQRNNFYIKQDLPEFIQDTAEKTYLNKGFFLNLPFVSNARNGLNWLKSNQDKFDCYICTKPIRKNPYCIEEKVNWVKNNLDSFWYERLIITPDKRLVHADFLIDDYPYEEDNLPWKQLLFESSYNKTLNNKITFAWNTVINQL